MDQYFDVFGRLHPLLLHLPIGLVVGVIALEAVAWWRGGKGAGAAPAALLWLTAAAAVAAVVTGLKLSYEEGYGGPTLDIHLWLGLAFGAAAIVAAIARSRVKPEAPAGATWLYRGSLLAAFGLMLAAGHFGAALTHGANFLFEPLGRTPAAADTGEEASTAFPVSFEKLGPASVEGFSVVEPIFAQKCASCHSDAVSKAGLSLSSFEALSRGSEVGAILEAEDPAAGELLRRVRLPLDHPDHMPPEGKRQLSAAELATLEAWILGTAGPAAGDVAETGADVPTPSDGSEPDLADPSTPGLSGVGAPDPAAVADLAGTLAHVSPLAEGSELLWVDVSYANPPLPEARILELLRPLAGNVAELSVARCDITDGFAALAAGMPNLRRLDLSGTAVTDASVQALAGHETLSELVLTKTAVTDAAVEALKGMPALSRVYLWGSQCSAEAIAQLHADRPQLVADAGAFAESAVLEIEPQPRLGATPTTAAAPLTASNTLCPVSGTAVDQKYLVVYEGRVIGFCCPDCPKQFWADPAKFAEKLKP